MGKSALYVGSFDPFTNGHLDIMLRSAKLFDHLFIGIATNSAKNYFFTVDERYRMVHEAIRVNNLTNVTIVNVTDKMTTDVMDEYKINVLVRGVRNSKDMEDEYVLNQYYKNLKSDLEEVLLITNYPSVSSSFVKECIKYNKFDKLYYTPKFVNSIILEKYKGK